MTFKVAVTSSDGKVINQHFGRAQRFLIFELVDGIFEFRQVRAAIPLCGDDGDHEAALSNTIALLADCQVVLTSRISPGAEQNLRQNGIQAFTVPDRIDRALERLLQNIDKIQKPNKE